MRAAVVFAIPLLLIVGVCLAVVAVLKSIDDFMTTLDGTPE